MGWIFGACLLPCPAAVGRLHNFAAVSLDKMTNPPAPVNCPKRLFLQNVALYGVGSLYSIDFWFSGVLYLGQQIGIVEDVGIIKKVKLICTIVVSVLFISIAGFMLSVPVVNDCVANKTAKYVERIELPNNTHYIETFAKAGKLIGNGNGMQYIGGILIKSELSLQELKSYYSQYATNDWECIVEKQTDKQISFIEHGTISFNSDINGDNYYVVYSWRSTNSIFSELDLRGH